MKLLALFIILYKVVTKGATFMFALFLMTLATIGLYDLLIHPFVKNRRIGYRKAA